MLLGCCQARAQVSLSNGGRSGGTEQRTGQGGGWPTCSAPTAALARSRRTRTCRTSCSDRAVGYSYGFPGGSAFGLQREFAVAALLLFAARLHSRGARGVELGAVEPEGQRRAGGPGHGARLHPAGQRQRGSLQRSTKKRNTRIGWRPSKEIACWPESTAGWK